MTTSLDYVDIPPCASRLEATTSAEQPSLVRAAKSSAPTTTSFPNPIPDIHDEDSDNEDTPFSPSRSFGNLLPNMLLSSALPVGSLKGNPRGKGAVPLLSSRDPLSIQITTINFKNFIERVGPVFWLQDRIEEIIMWRKGWKVTTTWIAAYSFICYFPRLVLLLPQLFVMAIILVTYNNPDLQPTHTTPKQPSALGPADGTVKEGSVDWQANIQAIQNLMGFFADAHAAVVPYLAHITHKTPYTPLIFLGLIISLLPTLLLITIRSLPMRQIFIAVGILPLLATNPVLRPWLVQLFRSAQKTSLQKAKSTFLNLADKHSPWLIPYLPFGTQDPGMVPLTTYQAVLQRVVDNNNLSDECWNSEMKEVELFENERLDPISAAPLSSELTVREAASPETTPSRRKASVDVSGKGKGWSKMLLRPTERVAWTRGRDGWNGVAGAGSVSTLSFPLQSGWKFVETENWRCDTQASWASCGGDTNGWVYTNDAWLNPRSTLYNDINGVSLTRRRRWVRRIWFAGNGSANTDNVH